MQHLRLLAIALLFMGASCNSNRPVTAETDTASSPPNVLLIILDDLGCDAFPAYGIGDAQPRMPRMEALAEEGLRFTNCWAYPTCTPTRSSVITGKHAFMTGMAQVGDELPESEEILQAAITRTSGDTYSQAVIGKWHLGEEADHPNRMGVPHYSGLLSGGVRDYSRWQSTTNGETTRSTEYITSALTNRAIDWVGAQDKPWFLWLAYTAPHTPFHLPPDHLHTYDLPGTEADIEANPQAYYFAMIEALDTEIGRLLDAMPAEERENTVILLLGDNGSPNQVVQTYGARKAKGSIHQGGINVPLVIAGKGVTRKGDVEEALVGSVDLYATILELTGATPPQHSTSKSLVSLFDDSHEMHAVLYSQVESKRKQGYAFRDDRFKLMDYATGQDELYDLEADPFETENLFNSDKHAAARARLQATAEAYMATHGHTNDHDHSDGQDHGHTHEGTFSVSNGMDCTEETTTTNQVQITLEGGHRVVRSNGIPNHDVGAFPNPGNPHTISAQNLEYRMPANPQMATQLTSVYSESGFGIGRPNFVFGVVNNGVKLDPSAAEAFVTSSGSKNFDWAKEALSSNNRLGDDCNNAHVQPNGEYHYHGTPWGVVQGADGASMFHLGWAADGFPIYYKWIPTNAMDLNSPLVEATTGYRLRQGTRPGDGIDTPDGTYDGTYVRDFEYVQGLGMLDEAGGRYGVTPDFPEGTYYYVVTDAFPSVPRFFKGTPDPSFKVGGGGGPRLDGPPPGGGNDQIPPPPTGGQETQRQKRFRLLDKNNDGRIQKSEAGPKILDRWDQLDKNQDGVVDPEEFGI